MFDANFLNMQDEADGRRRAVVDNAYTKLLARRFRVHLSNPSIFCTLFSLLNSCRPSSFWFESLFCVCLVMHDVQAPMLQYIEKTAAADSKRFVPFLAFIALHYRTALCVQRHFERLTVLLRQDGTNQAH